MAVNIAAQCAECCDCPAPTLEWDSRSASKTKCGMVKVSGPFVDCPNVLFLTAVTSVDPTIPCPTGYASCDGETAIQGGSGGADGIGSGGIGTATVDPVTCIGTDDLTGSHSCRVIHFSDPYTTALLKSLTLAALPAYDDDWNDTAGSFANLTTNELTYSIRESRYRFRFEIPLVGSGLCYRLEWVERFILEAGVGIDSIEVFSAGVYRPTVTATGGGGTGCRLVAAMSSSGTVTSVRVLNPGSGYTSAPTITLQSAINGGTTSTGWTATLTGGRITAVAGGSAGNYRPTLAISAPGGGGTTATATTTMDAQGGIAAAPIGTAGTLYLVTPTLTITPKVSGSTAASLGLHLGTETDRCAEWDGSTPGGYDPEDPTTYPIIGDGTNPYFELPVPSSDGLTTVALIRAFCDCSACP